MGISNTTENAILDLIFRAVAWTDYAINHTTTPQTHDQPRAAHRRPRRGAAPWRPAKAPTPTTRG